MLKDHFHFTFWLYAVTLAVLSVLPINSLSAKINDVFVLQIRLDYLLHALTLIPWSFLLFQYKQGSKSIFCIIFSGVIFSIICEGIQYFLPYRAFNINDLAANFLGVVLGSVVLIPGVYKTLNMILNIK